MGNEPVNSQKSETRGQKFIQVFPGNEKTWINCEEATVLSQLHGCCRSSELPKNLALACRRWEPQNSRSTGFTLPELTRAEQTACPPPGMLVSQSLGIWISWWGFWLMSVILCYDLSVFYGIIYLRYELLCMLIQFIQRGSYTYRAI